MTYLVFARKWRPQNFDDVVGQEHVTTTLKNAIKMDRVAHSYLFAGPRGVGKTSTARILAKALNCQKGPTITPCGKCPSCLEITRGSSLDVLEIDGASNRGVEEVRNLRDNVKLAPAHGKFKVYIIDEVHMLTPEAFNALLKTLEEPPAHVKFVFATTQAYKLIPTIVSRCQRFDFRKLGVERIVSKLEEIAESEALSIEEDALYAIARASEGSMRDAESILDQLGTFSKKAVKLKDVHLLLGMVEQEFIFNFTERIAKRDAAGCLKLIDEFIKGGRDSLQLIDGLMGHFRNLLIAKQGEGLNDLLDLNQADKEALYIQAGRFSAEDIFYVFNVLANAQAAVRSSKSARIPLEMAIAKLAGRARIESLDKILKRLDGMLSDLGEGDASEETAPLPPKKEPAVREEAKEDTPAQLNLDKINKAWPAVLKEMRAKKISAASFLLEASPVEFSGSTCTIGFPKGYAFHKESLERDDNRELLQEILSRLLEENIKVDFVISEAMERQAPSGDYANPGAEEPLIKKEWPEASSEPVVRSALDLFKGRLVE